jgi:hypothetical protein
MVQNRFVGSSKPTIKDNRLENRFPVICINTCKDFTEFAAVNYDKWDICDPACSLGQGEVPVYKFQRSVG